MKKQLNNLNNLSAFIILLVVVAGCKFWAETSGGNANVKNENAVVQNKKSDTKKSLDNDEKTAKGGLAEKLFGTWEGNPDREEKITMTFAKNNSIEIETDDGEEKSTVNATYRVIDEKTVEIKFDDGKTRKLADVKINGDTMDAKGKNGRPATFKRVGGKTNDSENSSDDDV